ncbi:Chromosome partition protein Smc [bacterium HR29]|nr:Chromosome partition protein Smc [bacterium HR29]
MYLKKLSLHGFKSFPSRTVLEFGPGITAIVGPNGSGKSNVADAIRWVLGEQNLRLLRARKLEDVIFNGGPKRAALGMAEVILTLDNEDRWLPIDFAEVEIGRRLYRSGESEYLLNGSRVRLRDIQELLMKGDVGQNSYTIMAQGLVDEVLSLPPQERRIFLDEAADVKRFRHRIKEAQDRLAATRENLERVELIVEELRPRLGQLERQAERAAEHARLSTELVELLKTYYGQLWNEAQHALVRSRAALDQCVAEEAAAAQRLERLRGQLRALGEEIRRRREAIARRDAAQSGLEQRLAETERALSLDRERLGMLAARREELRLELEALEAERLSLSTADVDEGRRGLALAEEVEARKAALADAREALELAEREFAALRGRLQEFRAGAEADDRRIGASEADVQAAEGRLAALEREEADLLARRKQLLVELIGYGRRFRELSEAAVALNDNLARALREAEAVRERLARVEEEVRVFEAAGSQELRELDRLEGRLEALQRVHAEHEGIAQGTRNVLIMGQALIEGIAPGSLGEPPEVPGVLGILARQLRVPAGLEAAINAALEHRLHAVVIERHTDALEAIRLLAQRNGGRAQFLPLDSIRHVYPLNLQKERGVVGVAARLVRCEPPVRPLVDTLLGRVIVVEDTPTALRILRRALGTVVTLDGILFEPSGAITGGSPSDDSVLARQRELEELPARIEELRKRTSVIEQQIAAARHSIERLAAEAREADARYQELRREAEAAQANLTRERERLHRVRREMQALLSKREDIARERESLLRRIDQARQAAAQALQRRQAREADLRALEEELARAAARRDAALRAVSEASSRVAAIEGERRALELMREQHEKALERLEGQLAARRLQAKNLDLEAQVVQERIAKLQREAELIRAEQQRFAEDVAPDRDELDRLEHHERQVQDELAEAQGALLEVQRRRLELESEVARWEERIRTLRTEMEAEGLVAAPSGQVVTLAEANSGGGRSIHGAAHVSAEELRSRIEDVRRRIRKLGPINQEAPEDYRETRDRYEFLTTQMADLREAEQQLRTAIDELNDQVRTRFQSAFDAVNESFGRFFADFFGGGSARLVLTDPERPAESGVEIEAQPPGKRVNSLAALSGGERSLTAVALLFALLTVNPAPFCVLDEVDAALDEANIGRFTAALRRLAERTQFLVVTHNRRTVEAADAIYGISMGSDGVSKVLSLRLADLPAHLER